MTYRITGLDPAPYKPLFALTDDELAGRGIVPARPVRGCYSAKIERN